MASSSHILALRKKHSDLEEKIRQEMSHPSRDERLIRALKEKKLHLKEEIEAVRT